MTSTGGSGSRAAPGEVNRAVIGAKMLVAFTLTASGFAAGSGQAQVIGEVTGLSGTATVQRADSGQALPLALRSEVREGDAVRTGGDGRLRIALRDASTLSLGADAELKLDHLALASEAAGPGSFFTLVVGYLRTVVGHLQRDTVFRIRSPSMVAAVRGTDWIESYAGGKTEIFVAEGRVLATGNTVTDWVVLNSGEGTSFVASMPHTPVVRWAAEKIDRFVAATRVP